MSLPEKPKGAPNFLIDFGPLLVFFGFNLWKGIYWATGSLMVTMPLAMGWSWLKRKHIPPMLWFSGILILIFGGLTIYLQDEELIKIKSTVLFSIFGLILLAGYAFKKPLIKFLFEATMPGMEKQGWLLLTRNWGLFFLVEAAINEFIRRSYSTDIWVTFKTFGFLVLAILFTFTQIPVIKKYGIFNKRG